VELYLYPPSGPVQACNGTALPYQGPEICSNDVCRFGFQPFFGLAVLHNFTDLGQHYIKVKVQPFLCLMSSLQHHEDVCWEEMYGSTHL
jgi:hypothetical protein